MAFERNRQDALSDCKNEPCTAFEERAAILEYCAGMSRAEAERKAREQHEQSERRYRRF